MSEKNIMIVDTVEALEKRIEEVREAQRIFSTYSQEQVDKIFAAAALAANKARIPLAKQAVAETGMGIVEDKVIKNHYASEYIYNAYKDTKTCGVIEEDSAYGIKRIAEPIGVVAAVIPTTNPTSTAIFKTLICLKTRNGIIISPHPRAKESTIAAAKVVLEAAVAAGAPKGIISWVDVPSLELTNTLMKEADIILATGGPGMVKAAYSSGKPALGVGAGNTPAIIDASADIILAVNSIIHSKTFDNGMICASEQSVIVDTAVYKPVKEEFTKRGCHFLAKDEIDKVRKTIIINGSLNAKIVGQSAYTIAKLAGVTVLECRTGKAYIRHKATLFIPLFRRQQEVFTAVFHLGRILQIQNCTADAVNKSVAGIRQAVEASPHWSQWVLRRRRSWCFPTSGCSFPSHGGGVPSTPCPCSR